MPYLASLLALTLLAGFLPRGPWPLLALTLLPAMILEFMPGQTTPGSGLIVTILAALTGTRFWMRRQRARFAGQPNATIVKHFAGREARAAMQFQTGNGSILLDDLIWPAQSASEIADEAVVAIDGYRRGYFIVKPA